MATNKVEITGVSTSNLEVLSHNEMIELFKKYKEGDLLAREKLAEGNFRLVLSILKNFNGKENMDDLFQVGCLGLMKAIDNFDLSFGVKFSTYAVPMILGEVKRYIRDNNTLRISRGLKDIAYKALKIQEEELTKTGNLPSSTEIAEKLGIDNYDVIMALDSLKDPISIFSSIYNDGGDTIYLYDQIEDIKTNSRNVEVMLSVDDAVSNLSEREKFILNQRFTIGKTQLEIADDLQISQAQVSRIEKSAIKELKKVLK